MNRKNKQKYFQKMNKFDILPSIQSNNNLFVLKTQDSDNNNPSFIDLNTSTKAYPQFNLPQHISNNGKPDFSKSKTLFLPSLNQNLNNNKPFIRNTILPSIVKNMTPQKESFAVKRSNKNGVTSSDESSGNNNESNRFIEEGKLKKRLNKNEIFQSNEKHEVIFRQNPSSVDNFSPDKQIFKRDINSEAKTDSSSQSSKTPVLQAGSPYFWYYRDKSKFSPDKDFSSPPLISNKLSDSIENKISIDAQMGRKFYDRKNKQKVQKNSQEGLQVNNEGKKDKRKKLNDRKKLNKDEKDQPKSKPKLSQNNNMKKDDVKVNIPSNLLRRVTVTSAKLRGLALSEKFIKEAKSMVYNKESHSLFPMKAFEYLFQNDPMNFPIKAKA